MIEKFLSSIIRDSDHSSKKIWDEWSFYQEFKLLLESAHSLVIKFDLKNNNYDQVCAISKSGLPLSSLISLILKKPLIIFSIGEFFDIHGIPIIGFFSESLLKNKKILMVDSHIHTGETFRLATKCINQIGGIPSTAVILADCRVGLEKEKISFPSDLPLLSLYSENEIASEILNHTADSNRLRDSDFWMEEVRYWASGLDLDLNCSDFESFCSISEILDESLSDNIKECLVNKLSKRVEPWRLYYEYDLFRTTCQIISRKLTTYENSFDTIIACSLGAVPLAFGIGLYYKPIEHILFLGNRTLESLIKELSRSKNILILDDIILQGSMISCASKYLKISNKIGMILTIFDQDNFPTNRTINKYIQSESIPFYTLIKASAVI